MITLTGFGWRYAGRRAWAVRDVDLRIERGERVLLLGLSGAGKSTLLAALAGLLSEDSGERVGELTVDGRAGILFQDPQTQLVMARCGDDVAFGPENLGVPAADIWPRVHGSVESVGFGYPLDRSTHALSGGEQQRLALAGVLALRPSVLLLDEPTANLDPCGAALIRSAVARLDTTLVLVEHRVAEALPLVDRVVVLAPDGIRADGTPEAVFDRFGDELAGGGVWVPGHPVLPRRSASPPGAALLAARSAAVTGRLDPTDLDVCAGEALAVLGPNGAGKSTLAGVLGGLTRPSAGTVRATAALAGNDAGRPPHRWRAAALATRIGSVFQNPEHQFVTARVADELALGPRRAGLGPATIKSTVDDLLARLRLDRLAEANPYTLSGGEQRRLSVATALATAPRLLVLDEPTFGQDRRTWTELVDLLAKLRDDGCGVVTVTHDADFVDALADRTLVLAPGAVPPRSASGDAPRSVTARSVPRSRS